MRIALVLGCSLSAALAAPESAKLPSDKQPSAKEIADSRKAFEEKLKPQRGDVSLRDGLAKLHVPGNYVFYPPESASAILVDAWGNPPESAAKVLGMLFPAEPSPLAPDSWGIVITFDEDGYVKDDDAEKMDYSALLKQMQKDTEDANKERKEAGYGEVHLLGWAAQPRYDKASYKLYWAKELQFGDSPDHTLNYNIRALGRRGVLVLNAVSGKSQLATVEAAMPDVLKFVEFSDGHRYSDFVPSVDTVATYGIGALVAGKIVAKVGMLKWIVGLLIAGKKFAVLGVVALGGLIAKLYRRITGKAPVEEATPSPSEDTGISPQ